MPNNCDYYFCLCSSNETAAETPIRSKLIATRRLSASTAIIGPAADTVKMLMSADAAAANNNSSVVAAAAAGAATVAANPGAGQSEFVLSPLNQNMNAGSSRPNVNRYASTPSYSALVESSQAYLASRFAKDEAQQKSAAAANSRGVDAREGAGDAKGGAHQWDNAFANESDSRDQHFHSSTMRRPNSAAMGAADRTRDGLAAQSRDMVKTSNSSTTKAADRRQSREFASSKRPGSASYHKHDGVGLNAPLNASVNKGSVGGVGDAPPTASQVNYNLRNVGVLHDTTAKLRGGSEKIVNNQATIEAIYKSPYSKPVTLPSSMGGGAGSSSSGKHRSTGAAFSASGSGAAGGAGAGFAGAALLGVSGGGGSGGGSGGGRSGSAIDRALGVGRTASGGVGGGNSNSSSSGVLLSKAVAADPSKQSKLSAMFEENIIEKLDNALVGRKGVA